MDQEQLATNQDSLLHLPLLEHKLESLSLSYKKFSIGMNLENLSPKNFQPSQNLQAGFSQFQFQNPRSPRTPNSFILKLTRKLQQFDYELIKKIGSGSFSIVWEVQHKVTKTSYAMKTIHQTPNPPTSSQPPNHSPTPIPQDNFRELIHIAKPRTLTVQYHKFCYCPGDQGQRVPVIIQELMKSDLRKYIKWHSDCGQQVSPDSRKEVIKGLLQAVEEIHSQQILHKDIKPDNVFLGFDGSLKLGDFGMAQTLWSWNVERDVVIGTPGYLAPE
jgi:serine/threonine protein kinase